MQMKIALLSFHNAANYGAALQAYALQRFLLNNNIDNEYINYINIKRHRSYSMSFLIFESLCKCKIKSFILYTLGAPFLYRRKLSFRKFYCKNLIATKQVFTSSSEAEILNGKYKKFIVGSDQVWNFDNNGNDFAYFLNFVKDNNKKISYSSSFGLSDIPEMLRTQYSQNILKFKHLAVREAYGVKLIKDLTNRDAKLVLDPVFLLSKSEWLSISSNKYFKNKFIFSYTNGESQIDDFLKITNFCFKSMKHYKLSRHTKILDFLSPNTKVKYTMSPTDFVDVVANAHLVVSASFHCIAMSIILNKQFVAILSGDIGKDERILSMLSILGLNDRILSKSMDLDKVNDKIDYNEVNLKILKYKAESINYLLTSISE